MIKESYFETILKKRYSRRDFMKLSALTASSAFIPFNLHADHPKPSMLNFTELQPSKSLGLLVAKEYKAQTLLIPIPYLIRTNNPFPSGH